MAVYRLCEEFIVWVKIFQFICYGETCMLIFLLVRNICIYYVLFNEFYLLIIDYSYFFVIKINIL